MIMGEMAYKNNYDYLVIPLLASFATEGKTKFFIQLGPYAGYLLSFTQKTDAFAGYPKHKSWFTSEVQKLDYGYSGGLGIRIPFGEKTVLEIAARGDRSLRKLNWVDGGAKPVSVGLLVGMKYKL